MQTTNTQGLGPKRYRCAQLNSKDRDELQRLIGRLDDFCEATGVGLSLIASYNVTRKQLSKGHEEGCYTIQAGANLHALPYATWPVALMIGAVANKTLPLKSFEAASLHASSVSIVDEQIRLSLEEAPAGDAVLEGFHDSRPRFSA